MTGRERAALLAVASFVAALGLFVVRHFDLTTDITSFLPSAEDRALASLSREIMDSDLSRTMVLALEARDAETAAAASRRLETLLRADPVVAAELAFLEGGPAAEVERAAFELFAPRRLAYLADTEEAARARLSDEGLAASAAALKAALAGPLSPMIGRIASEDPFLVLPSLLERVQSSRAGSLAVFDGRFLAADRRTAILFLGTRHSALNEARQAPLLAALDRAFEALEREIDGPLRLEQSGVNRYAVRAASTIRSDIQRVSIVSSIVLFCGLLFLFRSLRLVALASVPIGAGLLAGCAASLAFFGRVHGISLAFGAALISVSVDYVVHLYCHDALVRPEGGARASLRALRRPLATGCLTTLTGFAALAASRLDGLREIGTFAIAGIAMAFVATVVFVPPAIRRPQRMGLDRERWIVRIVGLVDALRARRRLLAFLPLGLLAFVAIAGSTARWESDFARMSRLDADIRAEDERVRAKVARFEQMRFVVALGRDDEAALRVNERVAPRLEAAVRAGELDTYSSVAALLPSAATQRAVAAVATQDETLGRRFDAAFAGAGFRRGPFAGFRATLSAAPPEPLEVEDLLASPLAGIVRPFRTVLGDRVAYVSFLGAVHDPEALQARVEPIDGAHLLEQSALLESGQEAYQRSAIHALGIGLALVVAMLGLRYRRARPALCAFVPPILAVATTVSVLAAAGDGIDFITLTSLLFITCLGVDYSVLLVDAALEGESRALAAAMTGATIASGTTAFAFGLLALSPHPILGRLGLTTFVGVAASFLLAPLILVVIGGGGGGGAGEAAPEARSA